MTTTESRPPGGQSSGPTDGGVGTTVVLDTCVLLADPFSLYAFGDADIVIPLTVIEELDGHKSRLDDVGRAARAVVRDLERLRVDSGGDFREPVPLPTGGTVRVAINGLVLDRVAALGLNPDKADNRILAAALGLTEHAGARVKIVSADAALRIKASQLGLAAEDYHRANKGRDALGVRGWHKVDTDRQLIDSLYANGTIEIPAAFDGMVTNEYVVLSAGSSSALARVFGDRLHLVERRRQVWGLNARSKEQIFALDLLMDPDVAVVALSGFAGTGKTILALAAGLEQVMEPAVDRRSRYDKLAIYRPVVAHGKADLGFLPGGLEEKLSPWMAAILDNVTALTEHRSYADARRVVDEMVAMGRLSLESVTFLRGRSLQNQFVIVDEAQNLEVPTLKTLLTRVAEGTKIVFTGDLAQIDTPYVSAHNNALAVLMEAFAGQECFGAITLCKGERSRVADLAADLL
ncbi:MAG: PhoH-like ATPase [Actinomycetota bacterium]|nr:PhoH-like ATPase [Actinomycetota bacterium]MDQ1566434.1 PhoH-like ATPase [Actinomycetota bacterium]